MSKRRERVLIINDDGIDAQGIKILQEAACRQFDDVWVVAPADHQSGMARSIGLQRRLHLRCHGDKRFSVTGSPVDTLLVALHTVFKERKPDIVLSGVNQGGNLGEDIGYSGTSNVAMEAVMHGMRAFAFSQVYQQGQDKWSASLGHLDEVLSRVLELRVGPECMINVNFPAVSARDVRGWSVVPQGLRESLTSLSEDPSGEANTFVFGLERGNKPNGPASDITACGRGEIAITPLRVTHSHDAVLPFLVRDLADKAPLV